ncbi:MAG: hypothetical protein IT376_09335 [Polyangiaceae bacterium]|nr:hypothetical protein [Polyangiaceae bacterium]
MQHTQSQPEAPSGPHLDPTGGSAVERASPWSIVGRVVVVLLIAALVGRALWRKWGGADAHTFAVSSFGTMSAPVKVSGGKLAFVAAADSLDADGSNRVLLTAVGRRGGKDVATLRCELITVGRARTEGSPSWNPLDCDLAVPAEGIDELAITTALEDPAKRLVLPNLRITAKHQ